MSDVDQLTLELNSRLGTDHVHYYVAAAVVQSNWLRDRDAAHRLSGAIRVVSDAQDEREDIAVKLRIEHWISLAPQWGVGRNVPVCGRCRHGDGVNMRWPCGTLQILGWPKPPELVASDMRHSVDHIRYHATAPEATP